jgi:hypothetical protein
MSVLLLAKDNWQKNETGKRKTASCRMLSTYALQFVVDKQYGIILVVVTVV